VTSVTFETATIADAIRRAARIAPGKAGHAFDKAAGIFMEINPKDDVQCLVRATNIEAFHTEIIATVGSEGEPARWRLPSMLMANIVGNLPPKSGSTVKFTQEDRKIRITTGKMRASMNLIDNESYPDWEMFDGSELTMVGGLGGRVGMVEWAASGDNSPPLCGVYLDGEWAVATDRYKLARVPCKIENLPRPIIIPSGILGQALKTMGDTGVMATANQLLLAPDDYTQLRLAMYDAKYPPVERIFDTQYEAVVEVMKTELLEKVQQANQYAGAERNPMLRTFWGKGEIAVMMENAEVGIIGDVVECPGFLDHARVEIKFTPKNLTDALSNAPESKVKIHYGYTEEGLKTPTIKIDGGAGYQAWVMKRQEARPTV
jgi:DNA polymerase III sliding clamp (beta) subunit (PCNA family)